MPAQEGQWEILVNVEEFVEGASGAAGFIYLFVYLLNFRVFCFFIISGLGAGVQVLPNG